MQVINDVLRQSHLRISKDECKEMSDMLSKRNIAGMSRSVSEGDREAIIAKAKQWTYYFARHYPVIVQVALP